MDATVKVNAEFDRDEVLYAVRSRCHLLYRSLNAAGGGHTHLGALVADIGEGGNADLFDEWFASAVSQVAAIAAGRSFTAVNARRFEVVAHGFVVAWIMWHWLELTASSLAVEFKAGAASLAAQLRDTPPKIARIKPRPF